MDKDNLDIQHMFANVTTEKLKFARGEAQQEMLTAFSLMIVGLVLASVGLVSVLVRLLRLTCCNILVAGWRITNLLFNRKQIKKIPLTE